MKKIMMMISILTIMFLLSGCVDSFRRYEDFSSIDKLENKINKYEDDVPLFIFKLGEEETYENIHLYEHQDGIFFSYHYLSSNPESGYSFVVNLESEKSYSMEDNNFGQTIVKNEERQEGVVFRYNTEEPNDLNNRYVTNCTAYFEYDSVYYFLNIKYSYYQHDIDGYLVIKEFILRSRSDLSLNYAL